MEQYPVNEYYKDYVVSGVTLKRTARSWVAAVLVKDSKSEFESLRVYQWQRQTNEG